jgi:uncharacterized protein YraI
MPMDLRLRLAAIALFCCVPLAASAADGFVTGNVNLRAGPDTDYPPIMTVPLGSRVDIQGCLDDYAWCDVIVAGNRGWIAGNYVQYEYQGQRVYVPDYGARIGIPVVSFVIGSYWDSYYRNRPFYRERARWYSRPPMHRPPPPRPRPPFHGGPGPGYRPGFPGNRPGRPPGGDHRPPGGDHRPPGGGRPPGGDHRPPPRPNPGGPGGRPPGGDHGGRPPGGGGPGHGNPGQGHGPRPGQGGGRPQGRPEHGRGDNDKK